MIDNINNSQVNNEQNKQTPRNCANNNNAIEFTRGFEMFSPCLLASQLLA